MKNLRQVLENLEQADMHVHEWVRDAPIPHHKTVLDTHYIMQGDAIVHVGNLTTIESFAMRLTSVSGEQGGTDAKR